MSRTLGSILTVAGSAALIASGVVAVAGAAILGSLAGAGINSRNPANIPVGGKSCCREEMALSHKEARA